MRREKKKKDIKAQRTKRPTTTREIDALIGDEEEQKAVERKRKTRRWTLTKLPWTIRSPPTTRRDHTMSLFFCLLQLTGRIEKNELFNTDKSFYYMEFVDTKDMH